MAKKKAAATKVTAEELKNVQEKVTIINRQQMEIGGLEMQKQVAIERLKEAQGSLGVVQRSLETKYGKVSVNLNDGSLKPMEDEANKKN
jgi:hypothetical protein